MSSIAQVENLILNTLNFETKSNLTFGFLVLEILTLLAGWPLY